MVGITSQRDGTLLANYRHGIEEAFFAEATWGMPQMPNIVVAVPGTARLITGYCQATGADFRDLLMAYPDLYEQAELAQRLAKLARDAGWLGWGYGDYVTEQVAEIQHHFGDV